MTEGIYAIAAILAALQAKHVLADYVLQNDYILNNRHRFGHPGGLLHAGIHVVGTFIVLLALSVPAALVVKICIAEFVVHYLIDWTKDTLNRAWNAAPDQQLFWALAGVDQALHQLTYVAIMMVVISA